MKNPHIPIACDRVNTAMLHTPAITGHLTPEAAMVLAIALDNWIYIPASHPMREELIKTFKLIAWNLTESLEAKNVQLAAAEEIRSNWADAIETPAFNEILQRFLSKPGNILRSVDRDYTVEMLCRTIDTFIGSLHDEIEQINEYWEGFEDCAYEMILSMASMPHEHHNSEAFGRLAAAERSYLDLLYERKKMTA